MRFNPPGSFKIWIVLIVAIVLSTSFGMGVYFLKKNISENTLSQLFLKSVVQNDSIKALVESQVEDSNEILSKVSSLYLEDYYLSKRPVEEILDDIIELSVVDWDYFEFSYYDSNMKFHKISDDSNPFDRTGDIGVGKLLDVWRLTNGGYFFLCVEFCQMFIVRPLVSYDLNKGFVQISISIDGIIDKITKNFHTLDFLVYREAESQGLGEGLLLNNKNYFYEISTKDYLDGFYFKGNILDNAPFVAEVGGEQKIVNYEIWKDIVIFSLDDVTSLLDNSNKEIEKVTIISVFVLFFVLVVFYLLMTMVMQRINVLGFVFELITKGKFYEAKNFISKNKRKKNYDEIDGMYADLYYLTNELESTLIEVDEKNKELSVKFEESVFFADHDSMTGLINRRRFVVELKKSIEKGSPFLLVSLDLDHFKLVNDSLGHNVGDRLLIDFAGIISSVIQGHGVAARMGGDEFSIIIPRSMDMSLCGVSPSSLLLMITEKVIAISPGNDLGINISVSIGVSSFPEDTSDIDTLSSFADIAMYENKRLKANAFHCYNGTETLVHEERQAQFWQSLITTHLKKETFSIFFQAIVNSDNREVYSYEVLARIIDDNNIWDTNDLIVHAEKTRRVVDIDKYVFRKAVATASRGGMPMININMSYATISTRHIANFILHVVDEYKYPCEKIVFEITETQEISNFKVARDFIKKMKQYNFSFALDDFGSGFSSFYYLTKLGVDYIKIDKSIINELLVNEHSHHVVNSIVSLAEALDILVVAEGVENIEMLDVLMQFNINFFQGYYFSKPSPTFLLVHN